MDLVHLLHDSPRMLNLSDWLTNITRETRVKFPEDIDLDMVVGLSYHQHRTNSLIHWVVLTLLLTLFGVLVVTVRSLILFDRAIKCEQRFYKQYLEGQRLFLTKPLAPEEHPVENQTSPIPVAPKVHWSSSELYDPRLSSERKKSWLTAGLHKPWSSLVRLFTFRCPIKRKKALARSLTRCKIPTWVFFAEKPVLRRRPSGKKTKYRTSYKFRMRKLFNERP